MATFLNAIVRTRQPEWRGLLTKDIEALVTPVPEFTIQIGAAESYDQLFSRDIAPKWNKEDQLIDEALSGGRLLLTGRGGGAKTVLLQRCAKRSLKRGYLPVLLPMRSWTQRHSEKWLALGSRLQRIDYLLRVLSNLKLGTAELDSLAASTIRILIVDGLNEVEGKVAQELIFSLDEYAATAINTSVIVSDRLVRRDFLRTERWKLCVVLPLSVDEVNRQIARLRPARFRGVLTEAERELLTSPYFLNAYLSSGTSDALAETRAAEIQNWFTKHANLTADELALASEAAYQVYGSSSRTFEISSFERIAGQAVRLKLSNSGALLVLGQEGLFDHHLKHDFLASNYLARHPELWNRESFDHVTFGGSSFDAIMMCVEQVAETEADRFIRAVYDWNIYGVGYSLTESRRHNVSADMKTVILAMFAERKWDLVRPTAVRAIDTLRLLNAKQFLEASPLLSVFRLVEQYESRSEWFIEWRNLFTIAPGSAVNEAVVQLIEDNDSIRGWTVANVLKRCSLTDLQQQLLRDFMNNQDSGIRWRAVHALGAFPTEGNVRALVTKLSDANWSVRYGTVRSLLELASQASDELRQQAFEALAANYLHIAEYPAIKDELMRTMLIPRARDPRAWVSGCVKLASTFQPFASDAEREKWSRAIQSLFDMFAETSSLEN